MDNETQPICSEEDLTYVQRYLIKHWIKKARLEDAEDMLQEALIQCVIKANKYKAKQGHGGRTATFRTFLVTVGKNKFIECLRREKKRLDKAQQLLKAAKTYKRRSR